MTDLNASNGAPLLATVIGVAAIPSMALAVPLASLADLTARFTLVIFATIKIILIRIRANPSCAIF